MEYVLIKPLEGISVMTLLPRATATDFFNKADMLESKVVQDGELPIAADVAKDGYKALMNGDDKVVSGFKNKIQVAMTAVTPDEKLAEKMHEAQAPATEEKK